MIKIALVGYGAMGKVIKENCPRDIMTITEIFDIDRPFDVNTNYDFKTAIEFSTPKSVFQNIQLLAESGKNIVCGTTGWFDRINEVKSIVKANDIGFVYASNFSIGMRVFFQILETATTAINNFEEYDIMINELHHKNKIDSPSGTALSLGEIILKNITRKSIIEDNKIEGKISPEALHISSVRGGEFNGTHTIYFDSIADTIELTHRVKNRSALALGALKAVELIDNEKGFYELGELLNFNK